MIIWAALGVYWLGWLLAIRPALRARMLIEICPKCGSYDAKGQLHQMTCRRTVHRDGSTFVEPIQLVARGAVRDRNGTDAMVALACAAAWPVMILFKLIVTMVYFVGDGVLKAAPLTAPELERRLREREAEIERLTKQIEEAP